MFDFELTDDEAAALNGFETGKRGGPEPQDVTLAGFGRPSPEA